MKVNFPIATIVVSLFLSYNLYAQVLPAEGNSLHYRLIGFSVPPLKDAVKYRLEIAAGNYNSDDSFYKNVTLKYESDDHKIIAEVPEFGKDYSWRTVYLSDNAIISKSALHHFQTRLNPCIDTSKFRITVKDSAKAYKDAYVFVDDNKTLYDMNGRAVWYLPEIDGINITPRDLKLSHQGTITFLFDRPFEINYAGEVLWKAPVRGIVSGQNTENFNHVFTRLTNGKYMVLGQDSGFCERKLPAAANVNPNGKPGTNEATILKKLQFGTIIEYDEKGNVVWSWKSSEYFAKSDLKYYIPHPDPDNVDVHVNSFYFEEKDSCIYVSFKNISRVVKVKYPQGTVVAEYGKHFDPGGRESSDGLFCGQHACKHSDRGYIYMYDNNSCDSMGFPKILVLEEPNQEHKELKELWEYECRTDDVKMADRNMKDFKSGGNVVELPDQSIFTCMSSGTYNKLLIVSRDKQVLWSATTEKWNSMEKKWVAAYQYRANIIYNREDLERLIWNSARESQPPHILETH